MKQPRHPNKEKRDYFSDKDPNAGAEKHPSPKPKQNAGMDYFEEGQKNEKKPPRGKKAA